MKMDKQDAFEDARSTEVPVDAPQPRDGHAGDDHTGEIAAKTGGPLQRHTAREAGLAARVQRLGRSRIDWRRHTRLLLLVAVPLVVVLATGMLWLRGDRKSVV